MELEELEIREHEQPTKFSVALMAGGIAGTAVDVALFPIDTVKTRLQSEVGFWKAGGFRGIYSGLASAAIGSAPNAAIFFCTYEVLKQGIGSNVPSAYHPMVHMIAASAGEVAACVVRVPVEVVKQRAQANRELSSLQVLRMTVGQEGFRGLYRGYLTTVMREIPFSFIQMPLWELGKKVWSKQKKSAVDPWEAAVCGALAGGFSAAVTTPLDVAKTRIMLAKAGSETASSGLTLIIRNVWRQEGLKGLFAGVIPRTMWISIGGCIFFGMYEKSKSILT
ncbi:mitochondrial S-adenosylmethionine carrier protein-like [Ptychodera flava]|uniref:mitochondrial S-adenosylmethionine carrier protein-like n=1 Tax=Ptychodera flava TaxID=63121 RepID=UPI00396A2D6A